MTYSASYVGVLRYLYLHVSDPHSEYLMEILENYKDEFEEAQGSSHNHQTWKGGYLDHVLETMKIAVKLYYLKDQFNREFEFTLSDALLVLFLHDIEKPFKPFKDKEDRARFRQTFFDNWKWNFSDEVKNALKYVEGEGNDYSSENRIMGPLAAFCHCCDVISSRIWFDYPKKDRE